MTFPKQTVPRMAQAVMDLLDERDALKAEVEQLKAGVQQRDSIIDWALWKMSCCGAIDDCDPCDDERHGEQKCDWHEMLDLISALGGRRVA